MFFLEEEESKNQIGKMEEEDDEDKSDFSYKILVNNLK